MAMQSSNGYLFLEISLTTLLKTRVDQCWLGDRQDVCRTREALRRWKYSQAGLIGKAISRLSESKSKVKVDAPPRQASSCVQRIGLCVSASLFPPSPRCRRCSRRVDLAMMTVPRNADAISDPFVVLRRCAKSENGEESCSRKTCDNHDALLDCCSHISRTTETKRFRVSRD